MSKTVNRGLVFGKFYPPHLGHKMLIEWAARSTDKLQVLVIGHPSDEIPAEIRAQWIAKIHEGTYYSKHPLYESIYAGDRDIYVHAVVTAQHEDYDDLEVYKKWDRIIRDAVGIETLGPTWRKIDYLFTSEPKYGPISAELLGAKHVLVDFERNIIPISGTLIRENPYKYWSYIDAPVRQYYAKRICLIGAESTGTTTTTKALAELYDTNWVPEYGRAYTIPKYRSNEGWKTEDFTHIAEEQSHLENEAAKLCNRLLFCDTDALTTQIFHRLYMGYDSEEVNDVIMNNNMFGRYDLTFLTYPDIPWEDDGLRESPEARQREHEWFLEAIKDRPEPVIHLKGTLAERLATAQKAIDDLGVRIVRYE